MIKTKPILLILLCLLLKTALASVEMSAYVANEGPSVNKVSTYRMYNSYQDNKPADSFGICTNEGLKVYLQANASDPNGFADTNVSFAISCFNESSEFKFERFGSQDINMELEKGSGTTGIFKGQFTMLPSDLEMDEQDGYRVGIMARDKSTSSENVISDFALVKRDCMSYFNDSVRTVKYGTTKVNADNEVKAEVYIWADDEVDGTIRIIKSPSPPSDYDEASFFAETGMVPLQAYYEIESSDGIADSLLGTQVRLYYSDAEVNSYGLDEHSLKVYQFSSGSWSALSASGDDAEENYVSGYAGMLGTFAIFGSTKNEEEEEKECVELWTCTSWSECSGNKYQRRDCTDANKCGTSHGKPLESRKCTYYTKTMTKPVPENSSQPAVEGTRQSGEKVALFDINAEILSQTDKELLVKITLLNFGGPGQVLANLGYALYSDSGSIEYKENETVRVETQTEFLKTFDISGLEDGNYTLLLNLNYQGQKAPAQTKKTFVVSSKKQGSGLLYITIAALLSVCAIAVTILTARRRDKGRDMLPLTETGSEQLR